MSLNSTIANKPKLLDQVCSVFVFPKPRFYVRYCFKAAGGKWNGEKKVWELPYKEVVELGLTDRMIEE